MLRELTVNYIISSCRHKNKNITNHFRIYGNVYGVAEE